MGSEQSTKSAGPHAKKDRGNIGQRLCTPSASLVSLAMGVRPARPLLKQGAALDTRSGGCACDASRIRSAPSSDRPNVYFSTHCPRRVRPGLSIVEMLTALAITAMLLTATMVATDASFKAYAQTVAQASTQAATRMVTHRLMSMVRTSTAHGPLMPDAGAQPITLNGDTITSNYLELVDSRNNLVRVEYRAQEQELWATITPLAGGAATSQPLLSGVTDCTFFVHRRLDEDNVFVLERATMDLTAQPPADATVELENSKPRPVRVVASTMPRQLE